MVAPKPSAPTPFTRLPVTDIGSAGAAVSDIYDKLARLSTLHGQLPEPAEGKLIQDAGQSRARGTTRMVLQSAQIQVEDSVVLAVLAKVAVLILPDAATCNGHVFYLKNSKTSTQDFSLGTYKLSQLVDYDDPGNYIVPPEHAIIVASSGDGWIVLATYL